jgi:hypothetical protein
MVKERWRVGLPSLPSNRRQDVEMEVIRLKTWFIEKETSIGRLSIIIYLTHPDSIPLYLVTQTLENLIALNWCEIDATDSHGFSDLLLG